MSRRGFLRVSLLSGIAAGAGFIYKSTEAVGFDRWFRWMVRGAGTRWLGPRPRVCLMGCASYDEDILGHLRDGWSKAGMPELRGLRVVLKPNLVDYSGTRPAFTDRRVTQGLIRLAREQGARDVVVAEGSAFRQESDAILDATGYAEMLDAERVRFVDLNYDDLVAVPLKGGYIRRDKLLFPQTIRDADLVISIPKLKTHHWTGLSASVKNLFGTVPGIKYGWPKNTLHMNGITAFLAELAVSLPTRAAAVVDGIVGMEGDGPLFGEAVPSGVLVFGQDLVAVDATCARLIGVDPARIDYLNLAGWSGAGTIAAGKIEITGEPLERFARTYTPPPLVQ